MRQLIKSIFERATGCELELFGGRSCALIDKRRRAEMWFSYRAQLMTLIERNSIDLVIDVGANEGQFGRKLRSFYAGEILSFEPVSAAYERLLDVTASDPKWCTYKLALGSQNRRQVINICNRTDLSSLLEANQFCAARFGKDAKDYAQEEIDVQRLDQALSAEMRGRRVFLKMDTQGYDLEVFEGAGDILRDVAVLQSEVSVIPIYNGMPHWTTSIAAYESAGFRVIGMFPVCREAAQVIEFDCLLARDQ